MAPMRRSRLGLGGVACGILLTGAALLVHSPGRTELWENYHEGDYFDRQVRQARADGIRLGPLVCPARARQCLKFTAADLSVFLQATECGGCTGWGVGGY